MDIRRKNAKVFMGALAAAAIMLALAFASAPLYRIICQVTGWEGTPRRAEKNASPALEREMTVQFNADVNPRLPWDFRPDLRQVKVKVGADAIISYTAENKAEAPVTGTAVYNVTPLKAGKYFNKTQCFCFQEQTLQPGQKAHMPVTFFIDPKIAEDRELKDLKTITLSYTFYRRDSRELEKAVESFYNNPGDAGRKIN